VGSAPENSQPRYATLWCHGAAGIGLARLQALRHLDDDATRAEIAVALGTTTAQGFGYNHSLCHGDLGNLELLYQAGEILQDRRWQAAAERRTALILESIERHGWRCGTPTGVESPGLMTGLAGIGYGLLRLAEPACVPSVLLLAPPRPTLRPNSCSPLDVFALGSSIQV
jgi:lantibiotic modifying enzyme